MWEVPQGVERSNVVICAEFWSFVWNVLEQNITTYNIDLKCKNISYIDLKWLRRICPKGSWDLRSLFWEGILNIQRTFFVLLYFSTNQWKNSNSYFFYRKKSKFILHIVSLQKCGKVFSLKMVRKVAFSAR